MRNRLTDEVATAAILVWTFLIVMIVLQAMPCLMVGAACTWGK